MMLERLGLDEIEMTLLVARLDRIHKTMVRMAAKAAAEGQ